jgi:hypothetical protein
MNRKRGYKRLGNYSVIRCLSVPKEVDLNTIEKFKIVENHHQNLIKRHKSLGKILGQLTAAGCKNAKEYWKDGKYLYLLHPMNNGKRKKEYIGNHPLRIAEARQKIINFQKRVKIARNQENIKFEIDQIEDSLERLLFICAKTDMSSQFALNEIKHGYNHKRPGEQDCTQARA